MIWILALILVAAFSYLYGVGTGFRKASVDLRKQRQLLDEDPAIYKWPCPECTIILVFSNQFDLDLKMYEHVRLRHP